MEISTEVSSFHSPPKPSKDAPLVPLAQGELQNDKEKVAANDHKAPTRPNNDRRKFLGVRQRPSGRWVAEIKESSQKLRLWLGTFDRPEDAALAYDVAARLLRGKNAKTNFLCAPDQFFKKSAREGIGACSFLGKNPRAYQLLQHAVMMNRAICSSMCSTILPWKSHTLMRDLEYDTLVEETVVCSSSPDEGGSGCSTELSFGSSKVYSSVIVAPSFSSPSCQKREDERN